MNEEQSLCPDLHDYVFTEHAEMEMGRRDILKANVQAVLLAPEQRMPVRSGRCVYQSRFEWSDPPKQFLLRVVVDVDRLPPEVVTVYRTSKIRKYWR